MDVKAVILAGGYGIRLWPVSRKHLPKQFISIDGGGALLENTIKRLSPFVSSSDVLIVTSELFANGEAYHQLAPYQAFHEPEGRNTAPAIGLAAVWFQHFSQDPVMIISPADHLIQSEAVFQDLLVRAIESANKGKMVVFGIPPTRPDTGFGYIQAGSNGSHGSHGPAWSVQQFVEKPDRPTAERYIQQGNYFWNSGIFVWKASTILEQFRRHLPEVSQVLNRITEVWERGEPIQQGIDKHFCEMPNISIDYGVLEKIPAACPEEGKLVMLPGDMGWSDVGSWDTVYDVLGKDEANNVFHGNVVAHDCKNTLIHSNHRLITAVGIEDLCIVETADAVLLVKMGETQRVRQIVEVLEKNNNKEHLSHLTVKRPWGSYTVLDEKPGFKVKRLVIHPQASISLQRHLHRSEHWTVVSGTATVVCDNETHTLNANQSIGIPAGSKHRLSNYGTTLLQIIEVQVGEYVEEDDIERFEDVYGRIEKC